MPLLGLVCANTGSSAGVAGWISIPGVPSTPECDRDRVNRTVSCSSERFSTGDQPPATLPAIIPAMAAAGPKTELELDLARLFGLSGVDGDPVNASATICSPSGVWGSSLLDRDREGLRDRGRKVSLGCCNLYANSDMRPPRIFLRNVNSSRISSSAGFQCRILSSSSSTMNSGPRLFRRGMLGINFAKSSSGTNLIITATGIESAPSTIEYPHSAPFIRFIENAWPPMNIIKHCPPTIMNWIPMNHQFRSTPSKTLKLLSNLRELRTVRNNHTSSSIGLTCID